MAAGGQAGIRAGRAYVEVGVHDKLVTGLKRAQRRLRAFAAGVEQIGARLAKLGTVMALPFAAGAKAFMDFERQMANVSTMLDEPAKHMGAFSKGVRKMSVEFGESTEALAGGLYDILSASIPAGKALDVLAVAVKAAKAGMTDTKTAADAITTILNSYGLAADQAGQVSDLLFAVVKRGKTTFAELAPQIGMVASTAANAGVNLEELGAMVATLTRKGVRTENAITAVNQVIASFLKPSAEASQLANQLGFSMSTATLKAEGLAGVFQRISQLPPDAIAKLFPNIRALRGVIPALQSLREFTGDVEIMMDRAGATEEAYQKMADTLGHSWNQLKQSAFDALVTIGEALKDHLAAAAQWIKKVAGKVAEFVSNNKALIVTVAKIAIILATVGVALMAAGKILGVVSTLFSIGAFAVKGFIAMLTILTAHPIIAILTAIAAAIVGIIYIIKKLRSGAKGTGDELKKATEDSKRASADAERQLALLKDGAAANREAAQAKRDQARATEQVADVEKQLADIRQRQEDRNKTHAQRQIERIRAEWTEQQRLLDQLMQIEQARKGGAREGRMTQLQERKKAAERHAMESILRIQNAEEERRSRDEMRKLDQINRNLVNLKMREGGLDEVTAQWEVRYEKWLKAREKLEEKIGKKGVQQRLGPLRTFEQFVRQASEGLYRVSDAGEVMQRAIGVRGTFYGHAVRALQGGTTAERTAKAAEQTAKNTTRLVQKADKGQLVFAGR